MKRLYSQCEECPSFKRLKIARKESAEIQRKSAEGIGTWAMHYKDPVTEWMPPEKREENFQRARENAEKRFMEAEEAELEANLSTSIDFAGCEGPVTVSIGPLAIKSLCYLSIIGGGLHSIGIARHKEV